MGRGTDKPSNRCHGFSFVMKQYYPSAGEIVLLPYDRIISQPFRPEEAYSESSLSDLILSIGENGLLEPLFVNVVDDRYYRIASGERRFRAAVMAGLTELPCIVISEGPSDQSLPFALIDDLHHRNLHYFDRAEAIRLLLDEEGYTLYRLSETLSVPMQKLSESLRLLELSEEIRQKIREHELPEPFAALLLTVEEQKRRGVLDRIVAEDFSLTEAKAFIRQQETAGRPNIMVFKDLNVFVNTVEHAVETMNRSGIASSVARSESEEEIVYTVTIRKTDK